ncbi:hypothetical protein GCM10028805_17560 [Spirosoma harenae]
MKQLLEWAVEALTARQPLRKNQVLGELNHVGRQSLELLFLDSDRPELGAVELLQIQVSPATHVSNLNQPRITCRLNKLMELTRSENQRKDPDIVLVFPSTQEVIRWLQTNEYIPPTVSIKGTG